MGVLKASGGNAGKGGGKSKSKGGKGATIERKVALQTDRDHLLVLRQALHTEEGKSKNVLADFAAFAKYERNGLALSISFATGSSADRGDLKKAAEIIWQSSAKVRALRATAGGDASGRRRRCDDS